MQRRRITSGLLIASWLLFQVGPIIRENPLTGNFIRNYFWGDQLAYLGIASSKSIGIFHATEPFTSTGRSIYPSAYYDFIGLVARSFHLPLASSQNLVFISASVLILFLTSRLLAAHFMKSSVIYALLVPIVLGTLNTFLSGKWSLGLKTHAVIWPISAGLYSANAESIGLLITTLIVFNFLIFRVRQSERIVDLNLVGAAVLVGLLANIHTYTFIIGMSLGALFLLENSLSSRFEVIKSSKAVVLIGIGSSFFLFLVFLRIVKISPLSKLYLLWIVSLLLAFFTTHRRLIQKQICIYAAALIFSALPQILKVFNAITAKDSFLTSRQAVSKSLSVPLLDLVVRNSPLLILVFFACFLSFRSSSYILLRFNFLVLLVWLLLSKNDLWGLSQEPYRFAIGAQVPLVVLASATIIYLWRSVLTTPFIRISGVLLLCIIAYTSAIETRGFWNDRGNSGVIRLDTQDLHQLKIAALSSPTGLVLPDPCIEPSILKIISGKQLAVYSKGLAWPDRVHLFEKLVDSRAKGVLEISIARELGISAILVDTSCTADWANTYADSLTQVRPQAKGRYQIYVLRRL